MGLLKEAFNAQEKELCVFEDKGKFEILIPEVGFISLDQDEILLMTSEPQIRRISFEPLRPDLLQLLLPF